ncbi:MAG: 50S ribosomal protein L9 [Christensenellaceae bacterium]|jgi:large subunit ribosomal protein L9|nr:50S ribosomal protein L9 [Christensenellaceae bacterium]
MQIYLLKDVKGKGKAGDIINVNDGYGMNFLVKNKLGKVADNAVLSEKKARDDSKNFHREEEIISYKALVNKLRDITVALDCKKGENGRLFGAITATEIADGLKKLGIEIDKRWIDTLIAIKQTGEYKIQVKFPYQIVGEFSLVVK